MALDNNFTLQTGVSHVYIYIVYAQAKYWPPTCKCRHTCPQRNRAGVQKKHQQNTTPFPSKEEWNPVKIEKEQPTTTILFALLAASVAWPSSCSSPSSCCPPPSASSDAPDRQPRKKGIAVIPAPGAGEAGWGRGFGSGLMARKAGALVSHVVDLDEVFDRLWSTWHVGLPFICWSSGRI